jgi:mRNA-degrading endonuclease RelE of RelBE toxin-antitoxin system
VLSAIEEHLAQAPTKMRGRKKKIDLGAGDFIYQLRVGDYRVFYDVDSAVRLVVVRHVRRKGRATTGEVL